MTRRSGSADLPLHGGRVPAWLADRMARLGAVMCEAIVHAYGRDELLRRLAHPFWFQSFGAVMGMDWHSSGITTSVIGALRRGLGPLAGELGVHVCGGRGRHSRKTPGQLVEIGERVGFDGDALARASRLVAKVDSAAVQDGFDLYLHGFVVTDEGRWVVVQQGMNVERGQARRYHWLSEGLASFVDAPHAAIEGAPQGNVINLADRRAEASRRAQVELLQALGPDGVASEFSRIHAASSRPRANAASGSRAAAVRRAGPPFQTEFPFGTDGGGDASGRHGGLLPLPGSLPSPVQPHLVLPDHHDVRDSDVVARRLHAGFAAAAANGPRDFTELLQVPGVGARTVRALALVAEVLHGAPWRFSDPARFSFAHGGKDRHPFPVPTRVLDHTIDVLKRAMQDARLGRGDRLEAIRRLDAQARRLEAHVDGPPVVDVIAEETARSHAYEGRSVFGWERDPARPAVHTAESFGEATRVAAVLTSGSSKGA